MLYVYTNTIYASLIYLNSIRLDMLEHTHTAHLTARCASVGEVIPQCVLATAPSKYVMKIWGRGFWFSRLELAFFSRVKINVF